MGICGDAVVKVQEGGLVEVEVGEGEGGGRGRSGDLRIDAFGGSDCRIIRLIGLRMLGCQRAGMEAGALTKGENCWRQ